jgi:hypothetical protein
MVVAGKPKMVLTIAARVSHKGTTLRINLLAIHTGFQVLEDRFQLDGAYRDHAFSQANRLKSLPLLLGSKPGAYVDNVLASPCNGDATQLVEELLRIGLDEDEGPMPLLDDGSGRKDQLAHGRRQGNAGRDWSYAEPSCGTPTALSHEKDFASFFDRSPSPPP